MASSLRGRHQLRLFGSTSEQFGTELRASQMVRHMGYGSGLFLLTRHPEILLVIVLGYTRLPDLDAWKLLRGQPPIVQNHHI